MKELVALLLVLFTTCNGSQIKARTTASGSTYEYIETFADRSDDKCYRTLYKSYRSRKIKIWKEWPDLSKVTDGCADNLNEKNYCFAVQFWGECRTDTDCSRYKIKNYRKPVENDPKQRWVYRNTSSIPDKIGGRCTNSYYCSFKCGYSTKHSHPFSAGKSGRIVGGSFEQVWPWMGALFFVQSSKSTVQQGHFCGATLISCRWAITSFGCIFKYGDLGVFNYFAKLGRIKVLFGTNMIGVNAAIKGSVIKKAYRYTGADVALLELKEPIQLSEDVHPVCLNDETPKKNTEHTVLGWGKLNSTNGRTPTFLMGVKTILRNDKQCPSSETELCFEKRSVQAGWCTGDTGGPVLVQRADGRWYQTAIMSRSEKKTINRVQYCAYPGDKQYGTKLSNKNIRNWIHEVTGLLHIQ